MNYLNNTDTTSELAIMNYNVLILTCAMLVERQATSHKDLRRKISFNGKYTFWMVRYLVIEFESKVIGILLLTGSYIGSNMFD